MPLKIKAGSVEPSGEPSPAQRLKCLQPGSIRRPRVPVFYLLSLWLVTALCLVIPLVYVSLIAGIGWGEHYFYTTQHLKDWAHGMRGTILILLLIVYLFPGVLGGMWLLFLLKPLFAPRAPAPVSYPMDTVREAEFVEAVHALCRAMGIRPPADIRVCNEVNAWVEFKGGLAGFLTGRKRLTIGLPFVAGLNARQLTSVLAHEFGHFAQGGGMRSSYLINRVNGWLHSRAYVEDRWDAELRRLSEDREGGLLTAMAWTVRMCLSATRLLMKGLFQLSFRLSRHLSQQMEFDADRYGAIVAGSEIAHGLSLSARALGVAWMQARMKNVAAWTEGRLVDDFADAVRLRLQNFDRKEWERVELELQGAHHTEYWHTHPADQERIDNIERLGAPGLYVDERPASQLFADFGALSRELTMRYYNAAGVTVGPSRLLDASTLWGMHRLDDRLKDGWNRFTNQMLGDLLPLRFDNAAAPPFSAMGWQQTVNELRRLGPDVQGLWARLARRRQRGDGLAFFLLLLEHDIDFDMPDGSARDGGAIREEYFACMSETDADAKLAQRVLGLFARRLVCATDAMDGEMREAGATAMETLRRMSAQWETMHRLDVARQSLMRLHGGISGQSLRMRQLVHQLAVAHRQEVVAMLETMDAIVWNGASLGKYLRERCGHWSSAGDDPLQFLRVSVPLAAGFAHAYRATLAGLVDLADQVEQLDGIAPIRMALTPKAEAVA